MFDGISSGFITNTLLGMILGGALIYFRERIATLADSFVGTNIIRDLDKPYAYAVLGGAIIVISIATLLLAFFP